MLLLFARRFQKSIVLFAHFINNCVPVDSLILNGLKKSDATKSYFCHMLQEFEGNTIYLHPSVLPISFPNLVSSPLPGRCSCFS